MTPVPVSDRPQNLGSEPGKRHLTQLDGVRAFAILAVFWAHWGQNHKFGLPWGTGVQLFFVLSGFLITGILLDNRQAPNLFKVWRRFYARRTLRIFPLFYAVIIVALVFNVRPIREAWPWHVSYLSNFHFVLQGDYDPAPDRFGHFWSLAVEEQFYLVWPFLALFLPFAMLRFALLGLIVAAPLLRMAAHPFIANELMIHLLPWSNLDALGLGGLFAYLIRFGNPHGWSAARVARLCLWIGLPLSLLGVLRGKVPYVVFTIGHTGLVAVYGWLVFRAAQGFEGPFGRFLSSRGMVYIGKISYGLYVVHNFTPSIAYDLGKRWGIEALASGAFIPCLLVQILLTFALAMASWHFFEKPINDLKQRVPYT